MADKVALPVEPQVFNMTQRFPRAEWDDHEVDLRKIMTRMWAEELWKWLEQQPGEVQLGVRQEHVVFTEAGEYAFMPMAAIRWQIKATPIGELVPGQFYFYGGSMHGKWFATDGAFTFYAPVHIPYWNTAELFDTDQSLTLSQLIVDVYERDGGTYRYMKREKR